MENVNLQNNCQCCFSIGCKKDLCSEYNWMNKKEIYGDMLADIFDLKVSNGFICDNCIVRLRDMISFKQLVLETQKLFEVNLHSTASKDLKSVEVKNELFDKESSQNFEDDSLETSINDDFDMPLSEVKKSISKIKLNSHRKTLSRRKKKTLDDDLINFNKGQTSNQGEIKKEIEDKIIEKPYSRLNAINLIKYSNICPFRCLRNSLQCICCNNTFSQINLLRTHISSHRKSEILNKLNQFKSGPLKVEVSSLLCEICLKNIRTIEDLKTHLELTHKIIFETKKAEVIPFKLDETIYKCQICSDSFKHFHKLNVHMNTHYQNFICERCGVGFSNIYNLNEHIHRHVIKTFKCTNCNLEFKTLYQKEQHNINVHKKLVKRTCPYCPERFTGHYTKLIHMIKVHNFEKTEFKCGSCEKVYLRKFMLNSHMRKCHMNERNHECKVCGTKFFGKFDLNRHMASHTGEKSHVCSVCAKGFARKWALIKHKKIHVT